MTDHEVSPFPPITTALAFIKRTGMFLGHPVRFDRVTSYIAGYTTAIEQAREALDADHAGGFRPVGVEGQFREQLRAEGRLLWNRWDLTIAAEAIGWTHDEPPVIEDFTVEQHRAAINHLRPLLEKMFTLPDSLRTGPAA